MKYIIDINKLALQSYNDINRCDSSKLQKIYLLYAKGCPTYVHLRSSYRI